MPIIQEFEKHNFSTKEGGSLPILNKKRYGNGLADIIPAISNFIGNNKELINNVSNVAKAAGSVADASSKVTQAVKAAKELNQLKEIQKSNEAKKTPKKKKDQNEIAKILDDYKPKDLIDSKEAQLQLIQREMVFINFNLRKWKKNSICSRVNINTHMQKRKKII